MKTQGIEKEKIYEIIKNRKSVITQTICGDNAVSSGELKRAGIDISNIEFEKIIGCDSIVYGAPTSMKILRVKL